MWIDESMKQGHGCLIQSWIVFTIIGVHSIIQCHKIWKCRMVYFLFFFFWHSDGGKEERKKMHCFCVKFENQNLLIEKPLDYV